MSKFSKQSTEKKLTNITLLDIREVNTKNGKKMKVQFGKDVKVTFRGEEIDLGEYNSLFLQDQADMESALQYRIDKYGLSQEDANAEVDRLESKGIKFQAKVKLT